MYNMHMITDGYIDFEWDDRKASINESKHGARVRIISARRATRNEAADYWRCRQ